MQILVWNESIDRVDCMFTLGIPYDTQRLEEIPEDTDTRRAVIAMGGWSLSWSLSSPLLWACHPRCLSAVPRSVFSPPSLAFLQIQFTLAALDALTLEQFSGPPPSIPAS